MRDTVLTLNAQELERLSLLVTELRYREALPFIQFLQAVKARNDSESSVGVVNGVNGSRPDADGEDGEGDTFTDPGY